MDFRLRSVVSTRQDYQHDHYATAVTWCACLVLDTCDALKKNQPFQELLCQLEQELLSNHFPSAFQAVISI